MDKNAIKKFAIWARRELIERVSQRAAIFGITAEDHGDPEAESINGRLLSSSEKNQRKTLISNIEEKGFEQVIEEVAYTWFNRFAALRFMEVNGYLPSHVRVFTNDAGEFKPQILSEAIHLELDGLNMDKVYELENANKTEELFKYLLVVQCNALNGILPGMFQRIDDYTELLLPDNLLREGSVIERLVVQGTSDSIPESDWTDQVQIIGWLYQYYNTEVFDSVYDGNMSRVSVPSELLPAATQLFTPEWVVKVMVENSLGRLWVDGHSESKLVDSWGYYLKDVPQDESIEKELLKIKKAHSHLSPLDILCLDPCSGSGHILVSIFDILVQIYEEYGYSARESASLILQHNIFGLDIDERASQLTEFALMMKARQYDRRIFSKKIRPNIEHFQRLKISMEGIESPRLIQMIDAFRDAEEYGSLLLLQKLEINEIEQELKSMDIDIFNIHIQEELQRMIRICRIISCKYDVVVTTPPYLGNKRFNAKLGEYIKRYYPEGKADLAMAMLERAIWGFTKENGYCSGITTVSWMYLKNIQDFRKKVIEESDFVCLIMAQSCLRGK